MKKSKCLVYALLKNYQIVYVGSTCDYETRIKAHERHKKGTSKDFDDTIILAFCQHSNSSKYLETPKQQRKIF